jgi:hypothetical protein
MIVKMWQSYGTTTLFRRGYTLVSIALQLTLPITVGPGCISIAITLGTPNLGTTSNVWYTVGITHINVLSWCCNDDSATTYTLGLILAYVFVSEMLLRRE